ncbi:MAG TPA: hypothetical protein VLA19_11250 [Herpetosiphonaceae bacterium]|nr:hypothetical protein [Herpetosiphonaceae bacterium]
MIPFRERPVTLGTIGRYWRISLGLGMVVIGAVALLLSALTATVAKIEAGAAEIWRVGKLIANNTVHVPLLIRTNQVLGQILPAADRIAGATGRIQQAVAPDAPPEGELP